MEQEVLGAAVLKRWEANAALVGTSVVAGALRDLPPELRAEVDALTPLTWIELAKVEIVQDAIAGRASRPPEAFHDEVIRRTVDDALTTIYRIALHLASDAWLVARTQTMFRRTRKIGVLVSTIPRPGSAELELSEWPGIRDRYVRQVSIGIERVLTLTGRRDVRCEHLRREDGASLRVRWTV